MLSSNRKKDLKRSIAYWYASIIVLLLGLPSCNKNPDTYHQRSTATDTIRPVVITETVVHDSDDPAVWVNSQDPSKSIVLGTDKNEDGALYAFDLDGKIIAEKTIKGLKRPNNVDVEYGLLINEARVDIAVVTERMTHKLRVYSLPDLKEIDGGGIEVFEGETESGYRDLMGISLYKDQSSRIYAVVGRKNGPKEGYLWQYELSADSLGKVSAQLVRKFGQYSGTNEIEAIAVDDELGYVYYSDEGVGIRKYYADPSKGNQELALFGKKGFTADHEGISIYKTDENAGYILVSDQQSNKFRIFSREGTTKNPHDHPFLKAVHVLSNQSDGSEVCNVALNKRFPNGIFIAMSDNKTFHFYRWEDIAGKDLKMATINQKENLQSLSLEK